MLDSYVPFARPSITGDEIDEAVDALRSGWLTTGPRVRAFEERFATFIGAPFAVALSSCTAGLHLALLACGVEPGDEVVTTPLSFCATANSIIHAGATPVFADVERDTMNLSPAAALAAVGPRTRALLPVHFAGRPADVVSLRAIADGHGFAVVEDAAHCVDGAVGNARIGTTADATCFSFYSTKNLTTGEGGMVTTPHQDWAARIRTASLHGLSRDAWTRYDRRGAGQYDVLMAGFKHNMTDLHAAIGLRQLERLAAMQARRLAIWQRYDAGLEGLPIERPAPISPDVRHSRHLYTILIDETACGWTRDGLQQALADRGIGTSVHFRALHLHRYYAERFGLRRGMFPHAEHVSDRTLSLPFSAAMTDSQVERVVLALTELIS